MKHYSLSKFESCYCCAATVFLGSSVPSASPTPSPRVRKMSICPDDNISILWGHLFQQPGTALRYTTL